MHAVPTGSSRRVTFGNSPDAAPEAARCLAITRPAVGKSLFSKRWDPARKMAGIEAVAATTARICFSFVRSMNWSALLTRASTLVLIATPSASAAVVARIASPIAHPLLDFNERHGRIPLFEIYTQFPSRAVDSFARRFFGAAKGLADLAQRF